MKPKQTKSSGLIAAAFSTDVGVEMYSTWQGFFAEMWGTFIFTLLILCISHCHTASSTDGGINGACVALCLYMVLSVVGAVTGGSINPAVAIGLVLMGLSKVSTIGLYFGSQFLGGILAWKAFQFVDS